MNEEQAWTLLHEFAREASSIDPSRIKAIIAIGSLPGGYYRQGQSDLDVVIIMADADQASGLAKTNFLTAIRETTSKFQSCCDEETKLEAILVRESELSATNAEGFLTNPQLNARLKVQGHILFGGYDLGLVPMPSPRDLLNEFRQNETRDISDGETQDEQPDPSGLIKYTFHLIRSYLSIVHGVFDFNKLTLLDTYKKHTPPYEDETFFELISKSLTGEQLNPQEIAELNMHVNNLRLKITSQLRL